MSKYFRCFKTKKTPQPTPVVPLRHNPIVPTPVFEPIPIPDTILELLALETECKKQYTYLEGQSKNFMDQYRYALKNRRHVQALENLKQVKFIHGEMIIIKEALDKITKKLDEKYTKN